MVGFTHWVCTKSIGMPKLTKFKLFQCWALLDYPETPNFVHSRHTFFSTFWIKKISFVQLFKANKVIKHQSALMFEYEPHNKLRLYMRTSTIRKQSLFTMKPIKRSWNVHATSLYHHLFNPFGYAIEQLKKTRLWIPSTAFFSLLLCWQRKRLVLSP